MFTLYLDESGDHTLDKVNPVYPVFVLGGVITLGAHRATIEQKLRAFKRDYCGDENIILHTADITRNRNGFEFIKTTSERQRFYAELNRLMADMPYQIMAVAVKKDQHKARYGGAAADSYHLAMEFLVERFVQFLSGRPGEIVAESRNPALDGRLQIVYEEMRVFGTKYAGREAISRALPRPLRIVPKGDNVAGLQLADLVVTPIGRHVMGKADRDDWQIIQQRFRRGPDGDYMGYGLKVFP
jgi:hypothetical protein